MPLRRERVLASGAAFFFHPGAVPLRNFRAGSDSERIDKVEFRWDQWRAIRRNHPRKLLGRAVHCLRRKLRQIKFAHRWRGVNALRTGDALAKASPISSRCGEFVMSQPSFERGRDFDFRVCIGQDHQLLWAFPLPIAK